jgi:hypothetical protein
LYEKELIHRTFLQSESIQTMPIQAGGVVKVRTRLIRVADPSGRCARPAGFPLDKPLGPAPYCGPAGLCLPGTILLLPKPTTDVGQRGAADGEFGEALWLRSGRAVVCCRTG